MPPLDSPFDTSLLPDLPAPRGALDLKPPEKLLLWAVRTWAHTVKRHGRAGNALAVGLEPAGCLDLAEPIAEFLSISGTAAYRPLALHTPCCPCLGQDEQRLLALISAQQNGHNADLFDIAAPLIPPQALSRSLPAIRGAATALSANGLFLPLRAWVFLPYQVGLPMSEKQSCARGSMS